MEDHDHSKHIHIETPESLSKPSCKINDYGHKHSELEAHTHSISPCTETHGHSGAEHGHTDSGHGHKHEAHTACTETHGQSGEHGHTDSQHGHKHEAHTSCAGTHGHSGAEHGHTDSEHERKHEEHSHSTSCTGAHGRSGEQGHTDTEHGHKHEHFHSAGSYENRSNPKKRKYESRAFVVGIGGPVGSGKTALMLQLCLVLRDKYNLCAVTNDIFTREDGRFSC